MLFNDKISYDSPVFYDSPISLAKERYRLEWFQSTSTIAETQDVFAKINGQVFIISSGLSMLEFSMEYDFNPGAIVEWWIRTYNGNKALFTDSEHAIFNV